MFFEGSAAKLAWCNEKSTTSKLIAMELGVIDMGFGYSSSNSLLAFLLFQLI
jgi:hypothetical protein